MSALPLNKAAQLSPGFSTTKVLVVGLVRNFEDGIRGDIAKLLKALAAFASVHWLLIESDSTDNTTAELLKLSGEVNNFRFISLGHLRGSMPLRTQRIAFCRNRYLDEIATNAVYAGIDIVLMADFDGVNNSISAESIASCWSRDDWDVCTANQAGPYYDIWALRHEAWQPNDCWASYQFFLKYGNTHKRALQAAVNSRMIIIPRDSDWIEVCSAFGGLAVYRRQALEGAKYVGLNARGEEICEHVAFHAALRSQNSRIFINPQLINADFTEHTVHMSFRRRLVRATENSLRKLQSKLGKLTGR